MQSSFETMSSKIDLFSNRLDPIYSITTISNSPPFHDRMILSYLIRRPAHHTTFIDHYSYLYVNNMYLEHSQSLAHRPS